VKASLKIVSQRKQAVKLQADICALFSYASWREFSYYLTLGVRTGRLYKSPPVHLKKKSIAFKHFFISY
jgi:hypothetical protein